MFECINTIVSLIEKWQNRRRIKVEIEETTKPCCIVYKDFNQPTSVPLSPLKSYTQLIQMRLTNPSPKPVTVFDLKVVQSDSHLPLDYLTQEKIQNRCVEILTSENSKFPPCSCIKTEGHSCTEFVLAINAPVGSTLEVLYKTDYSQIKKRNTPYVKTVIVTQTPSNILNPMWESYHSDLEALFSYTEDTK